MGGEAEPERLFGVFRDELWGERSWESEFTPSPYSADRRLREFVEGVDAAQAAALLVEALGGGDPDLRYWACVGLGWLGPAAGDVAATALIEVIGAGDRALRPAAVALEAVAPVRARELGVHLWPETMDRITDRYLRLGADATADYVEWFAASQADPDVVRFLAQHGLRDRVSRDVGDRLAGVLRDLVGQVHRPTVRCAAAEIIAMSGLDAVNAELVDGLRVGGPLGMAVVERVAAHPASDQLVPRLIATPGAAQTLAALIMRRRGAGLSTDPEPLRGFLRECVEHPIGRWPSPRYSDAVPIAIAGLRDREMLHHLLPMLRGQRLAAHEWGAVVRAFGSFAAYGRELMADQCQRYPDSDQLRWTLEAVDRYQANDRRLADADDAFRRGRVETSLCGAFTAYYEMLLVEPSPHAAFQLAWIDRAYGAPVTAERIAWIRGLGFTDRNLLTEAARPVEQPLAGNRFQWDCGDTYPRDHARAARIAAAGLPSLARRWFHDEAFQRAADDHLDRVRRATSA